MPIIQYGEAAGILDLGVYNTVWGGGWYPRLKSRIRPQKRVSLTHQITPRASKCRSWIELDESFPTPQVRASGSGYRPIYDHLKICVLNPPVFADMVEDESVLYPPFFADMVEDAERTKIVLSHLCS